MTGIITLGAIRRAGPCADGWRKLLTSLGFADGYCPSDCEISIGDVAVSNGAADAMWCLRCIDDPRIRVRAVMPAVRRASVHTTDQRVHDCIAAIERWLDGDDAADLKTAAWEAREPRAAAGEAASWAASWAAGAAARAAEAAAGAAALWAAEAAAGAAEAASRAAGAAALWAAEATSSWETEREHQAADIVAMFPPIRLGGAA